MIGRRLYALALMAGLAIPAMAGGGGAWAATASGARLGIHGDGVTRFVVDLSEQVPFATSVKADPYRVEIDIPGLESVGGLGVTRPWGAVNAVRGEGGHIVLSLRKPAVVKNAFLIPPRDAMGWRLVVDLAETTDEAFQATTAGHAPVLKPPLGIRAAAPAVVEAAPPAPAPVSVPEPVPATQPAAQPVPATQPAAQPVIVVTSPNAADPVPSAPAAVAPVPTPRPSAADRSGRGSAMISAPMPPPPERSFPPASAAAPVPAAPPPAVIQPQPTLQAQDPAALGNALPESRGLAAKGRDGVPVIVIDPGHGGVDPGATGVSGIYEKHITLAMARELKAVLDKAGRYRVFLTRDRDTFVRLRERVAIARTHGADLFISLHADAVQNPQIRGLSVYTLSQNASDAEAQALAEKENKADLIAGVDLSHESPDVAGILIDLAQRETMNRSAGFATDLVDEVGQELDLLDNTHRFAGFAVLKAPDVPAVLVEMGYLSNEYEEKQLRQPQYRARLAKALAKAVDRYFPSSLKAKRP